MKQKDIEIPFGAKDSELCECEYIIPEGYEAEIKDGRVIIRKIESEDEKIRKEIIDFLKEGKNYTCPNSKRRQEWVAYLEKQGEQKPYGQREECKDCQMNYAGECKGSCVLKRSEQKPVEWSEKDKSHIQFIHALLLGIKAKLPECAKEYQAEADWLKSLKDRCLPQPKQEWSEEDEVHRQWILECLADGKKKVPEYSEQYQSAFDWLKSLRPQKHWKPSEDQINVLCKVTHCISEIDSKILQDLIKQLKVL